MKRQDRREHQLQLAQVLQVGTRQQAGGSRHQGEMTTEGTRFLFVSGCLRLPRLSTSSQQATDLALPRHPVTCYLLPVNETKRATPGNAHMHPENMS